MLHTATALDDLIDEQFGPRLEAEGFHRVRSRRWVRATKAPIREVVHVGSAKHGAHSSRWGLSFDFVPDILCWRLLSRAFAATPAESAGTHSASTIKC